MRTKKYILRKKIKIRNPKTKRNSKTKRNPKTKRNSKTKRNRKGLRKKGGMVRPEEESYHAEGSYHAEAEEIMHFVIESFPQENVSMSKQFSCGTDTIILKQQERSAKISLNENGNIYILWDGLLTGKKKKIITSVDRDIMIIDKNGMRFIGMILHVENEETRSIFSKHSSQSGCHFIGQPLGQNSETELINKMNNHIQNLELLIETWKMKDEEARSLIVEHVRSMTELAELASGTESERLNQTRRPGELLFNVVGDSIVFAMNMILR